jgi:hypothetical protein
MDAFDKGLRSQDVHSGLRNVDPNSPLLAPWPTPASSAWPPRSPG